ncbi:MAG: DinB family protein [Saprospiraceae bacterium]|nr:DinB family protein [Saprospiraceae bacterium]MBP7642980.1 DinB family protein [Saprospiraceae bacterium]
MMDLQVYQKLLEANTNQLLQLTANTSGFERKVSEDESWNVTQILEHCLILESRVHKILLKANGKFAETPEIFGLEKQRKYAATAPLKKVKSPEFALPDGSHGTKEEILQKIKINRENLMAAIENGEIIIDFRTALHPFFGEITMSDWLHLLITHTERHMIQLQEILSDQQNL